MVNTNEVTVELRMDNAVFKCQLEDRFYNAHEKKPYAIRFLQGVAPQPPVGEMQIVFTSLVICEDCWIKHKENKNGLDLKEPSGIVVPKMNLPKDLLKKN